MPSTNSDINCTSCDFLLFMKSSVFIPSSRRKTQENSDWASGLPNKCFTINFQKLILYMCISQYQLVFAWMLAFNVEDRGVCTAPSIKKLIIGSEHYSSFNKSILGIVPKTLLIYKCMKDLVELISIQRFSMPKSKRGMYFWTSGICRTITMLSSNK